MLNLIVKCNFCRKHRLIKVNPNRPRQFTLEVINREQLLARNDMKKILFSWPPWVRKKLKSTVCHCKLRVLYKQKISKVNINKNFLIALWEFARGEEKDCGSIIQKTLRICKTFKVKSLTRLKLAVPPKRTVYNLFYKDI